MVCALSLLLTRGEAHTSIEVAVDGRMLVKNGKLYFIQGTGSLTILDLNTGAVVRRVKGSESFRYRGDLYACSLGIVMIAYREVALLDEQTLAPTWTISSAGDAVVGTDYLVAHDGYHTITCYELRNGSQRWSIDMTGGWRLLASGENVLASTARHFDEGDAFQVLDASTGKPRFFKTPDSDRRFLDVFIDDRSVYLTSTSQPLRIGKATTPELLEVYNLNGSLRQQVDFGSTNILAEGAKKTERAGFYWNGRLFGRDGTIRRTYSYETTVWLANNKGYEWRRFRSGTVRLNKSDQDCIEFRANGDGWVTRFRGNLPSWTIHAIENDGRLIRTGISGFVESLDLKTGRPVWRYVFPVIRRTMSFSAHGMPPMLTQQSRLYRRGVNALQKQSGPWSSTTQGTNGASDASVVPWSPYPGYVIIDPDPDDPFAAHVPRLLLISGSLAILPGVILSFLLWRIRRSNTLNAASFQVAAGILWPICFGTYLFYGRVDPIVHLLLCSELLLLPAAVLGADGLVRLVRAKSESESSR